MKSPLYDQYANEIRAKLQAEFGIENPMNVPQIEKICINIGMGSYLQKLNSKDFSLVENNLTNISGRKPVLRRAKLSVSNFKLRQGQPVGLFVTLRKQVAYNFLYKLIHVVYPRVRDFRGVKRNIFDKNGNCSFCFKDFTVFPETKVPEDSRKVHGLQVTIVIKNGEKTQSVRLMEMMNFPFMKKPEAVNADKA
jgi:large subunit ribosomal protein L5